jgi:hypothetical protein
LEENELISSKMKSRCRMAYILKVPLFCENISLFARSLMKVLQILKLLELYSLKLFKVVSFERKRK